MAAPMPSYSVSVTGKAGPKLLFSELRRVDLTLAVGELAQQLVDEFSDDECKYVVSSIKVGNLESGPYKDVLLTEQSVILQDMGYIHTIKHGYKTDVFTVVLFDSVTSLHANMVHTDQIRLKLLKKKSHPPYPIWKFLVTPIQQFFFLA